MFTNLLLATDSYKQSHFKQFPVGTSRCYHYLEARSNKNFPEVTFFGLQHLLAQLTIPTTEYDIKEAAEICSLHGVPFNKAGWELLTSRHNGMLPVEIKAVPEGTTVPVGNILVSVENTDPDFYWLPGFLETLIVQACWYPSTVCTLSRSIKKNIKKFLEETGDTVGLPFKLHDFGFRGVSSFDSAAIGGAAHLVNFSGTDTMAALQVIRDYYKDKDPKSYSIPASEHSTITSWGQLNELDAYTNMLDQYPTGLVACVSDSYNIYNALETLWGTNLKDKILNRDGTLVIRLDSGDPVTMVLEALEILTRKFGCTINSKGYKVLPSQVRILQGDGVNANSINHILTEMAKHKYSADNIAFGMGGALLQSVNRDTLGFAYKLSWASVNGIGRDVYKDPISDKGKTSKRGRLSLIESMGTMRTVREDITSDLLRTVYKNGELLVEDSFSEIRKRAEL
jgi:nicotinamide phosphoribosyltransferase